MKSRLKLKLKRLLKEINDEKSEILREIPGEEFEEIPEKIGVKKEEIENPGNWIPFEEPIEATSLNGKKEYLLIAEDSLEPGRYKAIDLSTDEEVIVYSDEIDVDWEEEIMGEEDIDDYYKEIRDKEKELIEDEVGDVDVSSGETLESLKLKRKRRKIWEITSSGGIAPIEVPLGKMLKRKSKVLDLKKTRDEIKKRRAKWKAERTSVSEEPLEKFKTKLGAKTKEEKTAKRIKESKLEKNKNILTEQELKINVNQLLQLFKDDKEALKKIYAAAENNPWKVFFGDNWEKIYDELEGDLTKLKQTVDILKKDFGEVEKLPLVLQVMRKLNVPINPNDSKYKTFQILWDISNKDINKLVDLLKKEPEYVRQVFGKALEAKTKTTKIKRLKKIFEKQDNKRSD